MIEQIIALNQQVPFVLLITAILIGGVSGLAARSKSAMITAMIRYFLLLTIGGSCLWECVMQTFFASSTAGALGILASPFQIEVALANFGLACAGIWAFKARFDAWVAVAIMATCFNVGTALAFLFRVLVYHMPHTGHALYADVLAVLMLDFLLVYYYYENRVK